MTHKTNIPEYKRNRTSLPNINNDSFKWTIKNDDYKFHFSSSKKISIKSFIEETIKKLNYYETMTWNDILDLSNNNHKIDIDETTCSKIFKNLINSKKNSENPI